MIKSGVADVDDDDDGGLTGFFTPALSLPFLSVLSACFASFQDKLVLPLCKHIVSKHSLGLQWSHLAL